MTRKSFAILVRLAVIAVLSLGVVSTFGARSAAQPGSVQLQLVVGSGLTNPIYVTSARDGTHRLFIVEQQGIIRVLQPGATMPTVFLNITSRVVSGGERGLLGLAFHPFYRNTGRFFVYYTRAGDGALITAEYRVSSNPHVANTAETVLLIIPHPDNSNHNGGMLEFGPDGYLYIGPGDGGAGNDPPNNAQNINALLGKILRIDIDHPNASLPYSSPSGNPFFGSTPGLDEIYAVGMRNPWRFSFDRGSGQLHVADVGQNAWEEIDIVVAGGNYGWRVFEGMHCTGNDPALCNAGTPCNITPYSCPIAEYANAGARCSITGGYVYRGPISTLPGNYVYGDYCSGEIFMLSGSAQSILLDTARSISSFGEDEAGEVYLVGHGGTIERLINTTAPCSFAAASTVRNFPAAGGPGVAVVTGTSGCGWTINSNVSWISAGGGSTGSGAANFTVDAHSGISARTGTLTIAGQAIAITQGAAFSDVPPSHPFYSYIGKLSALGITAGCGASAYCPDGLVTREQAAVLIERAMGITSPPTPSGQTFEDVTPSMFSWPYIEDFVARNITAGCSASPRLFCPFNHATREQIAVFIERALGVFTPPAPFVQRFADVDPSRFSYTSIDDFARRGLTAGCAAAPLRFCPDRTMTRGELAVFLVRAFGL